MLKTKKIEELASVDSTDDQQILDLVRLARKGIKYTTFSHLAKEGPFDMHDWSDFLHLSERTFQRYKKRKRHLVHSIRRKYWK